MLAQFIDRWEFPLAPLAVELYSFACELMSLETVHTIEYFVALSTFMSSSVLCMLMASKIIFPCEGDTALKAFKLYAVMM